MGVVFLTGCATEVAVGPPEPVVYYGWYGSYYGPYYWDGPVIVYGCPHGWHGHYHGGYYRHAPPPPHAPPPQHGHFPPPNHHNQHP